MNIMPLLNLRLVLECQVFPADSRQIHTVKKSVVSWEGSRKCDSNKETVLVTREEGWGEKRIEEKETLWFKDEWKWSFPYSWLNWGLFLPLMIHPFFSRGHGLRRGFQPVRSMKGKQYSLIWRERKRNLCIKVSCSNSSISLKETLFSLRLLHDLYSRSQVSRMSLQMKRIKFPVLNLVFYRHYSQRHNVHAFFMSCVGQRRTVMKRKVKREKIRMLSFFSTVFFEADRVSCPLLLLPLLLYSPTVLPLLSYNSKQLSRSEGSSRRV